MRLPASPAMRKAVTASPCHRGKVSGSIRTDQMLGVECPFPNHSRVLYGPCHARIDIADCLPVTNLLQQQCARCCWVVLQELKLQPLVSTC